VKRAMNLTAVVSSLLLLLGCLAPPPSPPPAVRTIAVPPPRNLTPYPLRIGGASLYERILGGPPPVSVADVLAAELRAILDERGYRVLPESAADGAALQVDIDRWVPDSEIHPAYVIVGLRAKLLDSATGQELWKLDLRPRPVPTSGSVTRDAAYVEAARQIAKTLLASWRGP
jgi:hypothetical protein